MSDAYRIALEQASTLAMDFHDSRTDRSPTATATFDQLWAALNAPTPEDSMAPAEVIKRLAEGVDAGLMGEAGPRFFGKVVGGSHPVGVAADWLTSVWGQNSGSYLGSPANAVVEQVVTRWLLDLLSLPADCSIGFTTGATVTNGCKRLTIAVTRSFATPMRTGTRWRTKRVICLRQAGDAGSRFTTCRNFLDERVASPLGRLFAPLVGAALLQWSNSTVSWRGAWRNGWHPSPAWKSSIKWN